MTAGRLFSTLLLLLLNLRIFCLHLSLFQPDQPALLIQYDAAASAITFAV
jgi:hypothetical protein